MPPAVESREDERRAALVVRLSQTRTRSHAYRSTETSRLQECSWQVWFPALLSDYRSALRRTSFKVQTVKAGHPQKTYDSIVCFLRLIELSIFQNAGRFARGIAFFQILATVGLALAADYRDARLD